MGKMTVNYICRMIYNLKPYPAYKDSGVAWLGEVPEHWEVRRIKTLFRERDWRCGDGSGLLLSLTRARGLLLQSEASNRLASAADLSKYKVCRPGELVMNRMQAWSGMFAVSKYEGLVSPDYSVFDAIEDVDPRFFEHVFKTPIVVDRFAQASKGIGSGFNRLYTPEFGAIPVPSPPLLEQRAIVRFLDYVDRRIRRVIRARKRRIKLLEEYKQALINRTVTGKIDVRTGKPYPKYKHSGVEWLGEVPEHWEVVPLKRVARLNPSKSEVPLALRSANAVFLPMEKVGTDGRIDTSVVKRVSELWNGFTYFRQNDVIVAKITPCFENGKGACLTNLPTEIGFGSTEFHVLRPSKAILPEFLYRVTILREFRQLGVEEMTGAAGQQRVPSTFIERFPTCHPPISEQTAIVEFLDEQTGVIDRAIEAARREIDLLKEFRTRLIADVVTGKVDVREAAA